MPKLEKASPKQVFLSRYFHSLTRSCTFMGLTLSKTRCFASLALIAPSDQAMVQSVEHGSWSALLAIRSEIASTSLLCTVRRCANAHRRFAASCGAPEVESSKGPNRARGNFLHFLHFLKPRFLDFQAAKIAKSQFSRHPSPQNPRYPGSQIYKFQISSGSWRRWCRWRNSQFPT